MVDVITYRRLDWSILVKGAPGSDIWPNGFLASMIKIFIVNATRWLPDRIIKLLVNEFIPLHPDKVAAILADDIFKCILMNENDNIPIQISLKLVSRSPIDNKPVLVQVMDITSHYLNPWWPSSFMHVCGTRRRWVLIKHRGTYLKEIYATFKHFHSKKRIWKCLQNVDNVVYLRAKAMVK